MSSLSGQLSVNIPTNACGSNLIGLFKIKHMIPMAFHNTDLALGFIYSTGVMETSQVQIQQKDNLLLNTQILGWKLQLWTPFW